VIIVVDVNYAGGYARGGATCTVPSLCPTSYPASSRSIVVGGGAVTATSSPGTPELRTVAHEIGHGVFWSHSFGGLITTTSGFVFEYDNPMDVMSGGDRGTLDIGTIAFNRYASGWIATDGVAFHRQGSFTYVVGPTGGTRMLVLLNDAGPGFIYTLGVRVRSGFDSGIPSEGVEVYSVDQRGTACGLPAAEACLGADRRVTQIPAPGTPYTTGHVYGPGSTFTVGGVTVEVLSRTGDQFTIRVTGSAVSERFTDDNGSIHEADIAAIAALGITLGCNPPNNSRYCPAGLVTRAEMAAFLLRAIGQPPDPSAQHKGHFSDVPAGQWYSPYVEKLFDLGITSGLGGGRYGPDQPVTRAGMAVFLVRAFAIPVLPPSGVFADVAVGEWYAGAVEAIRTVGITAGCSGSPLLYCPTGRVLRDQMGSFLARAVT
jgi:hypothetical protein